MFNDSDLLEYSSMTEYGFDFDDGFDGSNISRYDDDDDYEDDSFDDFDDDDYMDEDFDDDLDDFEDDDEIIVLDK